MSFCHEETADVDDQATGGGGAYAAAAAAKEGGLAVGKTKRGKGTQQIV